MKRTKVNCEVCNSFKHTTSEHVYQCPSCRAALNIAGHIKRYGDKKPVPVYYCKHCGWRGV